MQNEIQYMADVEGFDILTNAVLDLLNQYPGLNGREILYEELAQEDGLAFSADNGALVLSERRSITDHVRQECQYPFLLVHRTASTKAFQSLNVQAFFDSIGKWICREPIDLSGEVYHLKEFPKLSGNRKITRITRSNSYSTTPDQDGVQNWVLPVSVFYTNEYDMW